MKKLVFIGTWTLLLAKIAIAQEQPSIRQQADKLFERFEYFKSLNLYLKLDKGSNTNVQVLERIADCYYNIDRYEEAEPFYARVMLSPKASQISHYHYAGTLLRNQKFEEAKQQYQYCLSADTVRLKLKLATCDSAIAWMKTSSGFKVKNEKDFNTEFSDWGLTPVGKAGFIFTSDRRVYEEDADNRTGNNWFKLYQSGINDTRVSDLPLASEDEKIFNNTYHAGPMALNKTADTAYITVTTELSPKKINLDVRGLKSSQKLYTRRFQLVVACKKKRYMDGG